MSLLSEIHPNEMRCLNLSLSFVDELWKTAVTSFSLLFINAVSKVRGVEFLRKQQTGVNTRASFIAESGVC